MRQSGPGARWEGAAVAGDGGRWRRLAVVVAVLAMVVATLGVAPPAGGAEPCDPLVNPVACENSLPGNPPSEWDISGAGSSSIQGFATDISVDQGGTVEFKIDTPADDYRLDIYRMGWYGGDGARLVDTVEPSATLPQSQPNCLEETATGLIDCGNWAVSAAWQVPADAVSGIYFAKLVREDGTSGASHVVFVVRDDDGGSDLLFQTSDTTWQAYNEYGGNSLYTGSPDGRAYKVSYNRPFTTRDCCNEDWVFNAEYPMVRWLERNGYDVSYFTNVDADRRGQEILEHQAFLSVGHDEYWSADQRANVEAARDAGVNLAFFSGNEVFWKTRWEDGIDPSGDPYRTLVSYKETHAGAKIDPDPAWTGTWRDPRFSPPADGGRPENALTGQLFTVNAPRSDPIRVPGEYSQLRFWRNTSIANLGPNQTASLPDGVLGYEWDEDIDNGSRPPGLIRMSSTTVSDVSLLQDNGSTYANGAATHNLTLYRAGSGALVFGAGTVQWPWGLDDEHDRGEGTPTDSRMQQATVNLFADMGVQPGTLQNGLTAAAESTDTTPPSAAITSPSDGEAVPSNQAITISGTAGDTGGGVVGGVEVSVDDGATWHPADGRDDWSYQWTTPSNGGDVTVRARAVDDSGNIQAPAAGVVVNVGGQTSGECPCSVWGPLATPTTESEADSSSVELGMRFRAETDGVVTGVRFYKGPLNTGVHTGTLWSADGTELATVTFTDETASGWQQADFATAVPITADTTYVISYHAPDGGYAVDSGGFASSGVDAPPLRALADGEDGANGVYNYGGRAFPTNSWNSSNYWVDVVFDDTQGGGPGDTQPPTITGRVPADGSADALVTADVQATFSEAVDEASIQMTLDDAAGDPVAADVSYDAAARTVTLDPAADLVVDETYTATVSGATDAAGNTMTPDTWTFTTAEPEPVSCPCTVWGDAIPTVESENDSSAVELGMRFRAATDGFVRGVRFYKGPDNTGTHVGSLWANDGTRLASVTFADETASGWQEARFDQPVAVTADTTYVVSYFAPNGGYAVDSGFFSADVVSGDLRALADGSDGPNGVYLYNEAGFPTDTYNSSNYWVDVVFDTDGTDSNPPSVVGRSPADGAEAVPPDSTVSATFSEPVDEASLSMVVTGPSGAVAGSVAYDAQTHAATFTPDAALATDTVFSVALDAADVAGNAMPTQAWSFTTGDAPPPPGTCPCTIFTPDTIPTTPSESDFSEVEVGVRFRADTDGFVSGVRFYKGAGNTGTHVGTLWSDAGQELASVTFTNESAAGWQQALFAAPVAVTAGETYVASYHAPNGRYAVDAGYFANNSTVNGPLEALEDGDGGANGVYRYGARGFPTDSFGSSNYWVDVVFEELSLPYPHVVARTPQPDAGNVAVDTTVTARFKEGIDEATLQFTLTDPGGQPVDGAVAYDAATRTATLTPDADLQDDTTYTASVEAADPEGDAMPTPDIWSFTTRKPPGVCPCTVFDASESPGIEANDDTSAVEVGMRFRAQADGFVTGVRFYKGAGNSGTHVGTLWSDAGQELASITFAGESATGWQEAQFTAPVPISADTTYVVSYHAPNGRYALDEGFFDDAVDNPPLTALADGADGQPNGVYRYGARGFPTATFASSNYWVDAVFAYTANDAIPPAINGRTPAAGAQNVSILSDVTVTFSEAIDEATLDLTLETAGGATVPASVTYDSATRRATLSPSADLEITTTYTARVAASDLAGNPMQPDTWQFTTGGPPPPPPEEGPGGPVAVVGDDANPFSRYYAEILRTEGLNAFEAVDVSDLTPQALAGYDVVVLGDVDMTPARVSALTDWVTAGGNLIAMRPDEMLYGLLGLIGPLGTLSDAYLQVDTGTAPGSGIVGQTMQFHGTADRVTASDAQTVATLYQNASTATQNPAVTMRDVGTAGGQAVAFLYDLSESVVLTRQGNPAWAGEERDGFAPIRSDDQFFGGNEADWVDLDKVAIPQADEQQRLFANIVEHVNADRMPLPRFWYFPRFEKAVVVATGDDHGNNGTQGRFDKYDANSPANCAVDDWECLRFSSYIYTSTPLSPADARDYDAAGFEVGLHVNTGCANYTEESLRFDFTDQLGDFAGTFPGVPAPSTNRTHCIAWSDWASQAVVSAEHGVRFDTNYYYWPESWVNDRPGFMTGSGMAMRFAQIDGTMVDVYQAATQMTDESGQSYPFTPNTLLDRALGAQGYYGMFVANLHTDLRDDSELYDDLLLASAQSRGVPVVSSRQMLAWLDGRNSSTFASLGWSNDTLSFDIAVGTGAQGLTTLLPLDGPSGRLSALRRDGTSISWTSETIKGIEYARFPAVAGPYTAVYAGSVAAASPAFALDDLALMAADDRVAPVLGPATATAMPGGTATIGWDGGDAADSRVVYGPEADRLTATAIPPAPGGSTSVVIGDLEPETTYHYRVIAVDDAGNRSTWPAPSAAPARLTTPAAGVAESGAATFRTGALGGGGQVADAQDGELELSADIAEEFESPGDAGRFRGGDAEVLAGTAAIDGGGLTGPRALSPGDPVELVAAFSGAGQEIGLVAAGSRQAATFRTDGGGLEAVTVAADGTTRRTDVSETVDEGARGYAIERGPRRVRYLVDGEVVATHRVALDGPMRLRADDRADDDRDLVVERITAGERAPRARYTSTVLDAGAMVRWRDLVLDADVPDGTAVQVSVRAGNTPEPDGTWSRFRRVADDSLRERSRYIQYRLTLRTEDPGHTPVVRGVGLTHDGDLPDHTGEGGAPDAAGGTPPAAERPPAG